MCMVFPFSVVYFQAPILQEPFDKNLKRSWERMLKSYPDLKYLLPET